MRRRLRGPRGRPGLRRGLRGDRRHGIDGLVRGFEAAHDDYSAIMAKALADRLAEAFAERLHERVRRELWGYAPDEALSNDDLVAERYQGIRPAPGYPATPDHLAKRVLFSVLAAEAARRHHASRSRWPCSRPRPCPGCTCWHPEARYFGVGRMGADQLEDYAGARGCRWTRPRAGWGPNLADDARA